jgi:hypothetical protein
MLYEDEGCGHHEYDYDSSGYALSYYENDEGDYRSWYDWQTDTFTDESDNYFTEYLSDDGQYGEQYYMDKDGVYEWGLTWHNDDTGYTNYYFDEDTQITYYADDLWYYTETYDHISGVVDSYYADYYNSYTDEDGTYTSEVYASPDWTYYFGSSVYSTETEFVNYYFDSSSSLDQTYRAYNDGLYSSYYDGITDYFTEYIWTAPADYYVSTVSDDGYTYYYSFVDGDGCYSYEGTIYNDGYEGNVHVNDNGHETEYYSINSGCKNTYYDLTYQEYSEYYPLIDEAFTSTDGLYSS